MGQCRHFYLLKLSVDIQYGYVKCGIIWTTNVVEAGQQDVQIAFRKVIKLVTTDSLHPIK